MPKININAIRFDNPDSDNMGKRFSVKIRKVKKMKKDKY